MQILEFIATYGPWAWVVVGVILLALELVVPGGYFLWLGVAGVITGLASLFQPISWPFQFLIFGVLSLVAITGWLRYTKIREQITDRPFLNRRAARFIGHEAVLDEPIHDGYGRLTLDDSVWRVTGPELPAGQRIRVIGHDGAVLKVEPCGD